MNRSLIVFSAIRAGLINDEISTLQKRSKRREVPVWVTVELRNKVRELAIAHQVTQQSLLRHFLTQYLSEPPWTQEDET